MNINKSRNIMKKVTIIFIVALAGLVSISLYGLPSVETAPVEQRCYDDDGNIISYGNGCTTGTVGCWSNPCKRIKNEQ